jgi:hypothetical protein
MAATSPAAPIALTENALRPDKGGKTGRLINVRTNFFAIKKVPSLRLQATGEHMHLFFLSPSSNNKITLYTFYA